MQDQKSDKKEDNILLFWHEWPSQWYMSPFKSNFQFLTSRGDVGVVKSLGGDMDTKEKEFCCAEQFMMAAKAVLFQDWKILDSIMQSKNPKQIKALGRKVNHFNEKVWNQNCQTIVYQANLAKFSQNEELKKLLLATGSSILAEASPYDKIWGIGLTSKDKRAQNPKQWLGTNWLGQALMKVRTELAKK